MNLIKPPSFKNENFKFVSFKECDALFLESPKLTHLNTQASGEEKSFTFRLVNDASELKSLPECLKDDPYSELLSTLVKDGYSLTIQKDTHSVTPIVIETRLSNTTSEVYFQKNKITVGENSEVTVIDYLSSVDEISPEARAVIVTEIELKAGAKLKFETIQEASLTTTLLKREVFTLGKDSELTQALIACGGKKSQHRADYVFHGKGASSSLKTAVRGDKTQAFDFWLNAIHTVGETKSSIECYTVVSEESKVVFNSNIIIPKDARNTEAVQKNKNMILSKRASVDTLPKLEIACDEVKCAHGASVSPVSLDQLYYLNARGIEKRDAANMIINGFTDPVVSLISNEEIREQIRACFQSKKTFDLDEVLLS